MPIGYEDLTEEQFEELGVLKERIAERVRNNINSILIMSGNEYPMVDVIYAYDNFDLDAMRVFDKLLHLMEYRVRPIHSAVTFLHDVGIHEASPWITVEHVLAYDKVHKATMRSNVKVAGTSNRTFDHENSKRVCSLAFSDPSDADLIESIIIDRDIINVHEVEHLVKVLKGSNHHPSTRSGVL